MASAFVLPEHCDYKLRHIIYIIIYIIEEKPRLLLGLVRQLKFLHYNDYPGKFIHIYELDYNSENFRFQDIYFISEYSSFLSGKTLSLAAPS